MLVKILILVLACYCLLTAAKKTTWNELDENYDFKKYTLEFNKQYDLSELKFRQTVFERNLATIQAHNINPYFTYKMGVNHLTDRTNEEFTRLLGYKRSDQKSTKQTEYVPTTKVAAPTSWDWRDHGVITPVKDQGQCGSCWSFGTAEVIESYYAIATGMLPTLSEQQILDCVPNPNQCGGVGGCGGGTPELAYQKIIEMGGLASEWTYPYVSYFGDNFKCHFSNKTTPAVAKVTSFVKLPPNEYDPVVNTLVNTGPLAINVDASSWHFYESGVFDGCNKTDAVIDHVVLLVGYGTDSKLGDYWTIRNSWTPAWGEDGYIRIQRSSNATCTPDTDPSQGTGCNGGPSTVSVCGACGVLYDTSYPVISV